MLKKITLYAMLICFFASAQAGAVVSTVETDYGLNIPSALSWG